MRPSTFPLVSTVPLPETQVPVRSLFFRVNAGRMVLAPKTIIFITFQEAGNKTCQ
jgi:hypothetical protein